MAISKKLRFEVFKRDCFACFYCGRTPPEAVLETDHVIPVSMGGEDEYDNLVTACFDCNRGKGRTPLDHGPPRPASRHYSLELEATLARERQGWLVGLEDRYL